METLQDQIARSFEDLWFSIAAFLPNLLAAIIVLILGFLIAGLAAQAIEKLLSMLQVDKFANRLGMDRLSAQVGRNLSLSGLGAWVVKWFVIVAAFLAASDILGMDQVNQFLYEQVLPYFGNVIVAVAILLIGVMAANFLSEVVRGAVKASGAQVAGALATVTKWSVIIFTLLAALAQLQIAPTFLQTFFIGLIAMFAIAGGLAFGLGGKEHAKRLLDRIERDMRHES